MSVCCLLRRLEDYPPGMSPTLEAETGPRWDRSVLVWSELGSDNLCYVTGYVCVEEMLGDIGREEAMMNR